MFRIDVGDAAGTADAGAAVVRVTDGVDGTDAFDAEDALGAGDALQRTACAEPTGTSVFASPVWSRELDGAGEPFEAADFLPFFPPDLGKSDSSSALLS